MGVVYEAEQVSLGRRVALKVLPGHVVGDRKALERFRREAKAAARLHHTNIVPVFEVGRDGETAFYAMQFIQGQGLDQVIAELGRLRRRDAKPAGDDHAESGGPVGSAVGSEKAMVAAADTRDRRLAQVAESLLSGRLGTEGLESPAGATCAAAEATATEALEPAATRRAHARNLDWLRAEVPRAPSASSSAVLPGGTAISSVESSGRRQPYFRSVAQIGRQAAQGLAYAHSRGVVHRDIKPSNLLLDTAGVVWITDFGLAKAEDDGLTATGDILGTLRYMAPERFRGEGDGRADIYALGLTLYELLTLCPAHNVNDRLKLIERVKHEEPPRPRTLDAHIPRDLETIVLKAIDKDAARRYATAEAMAEDLRRFLDDEPIRARRASAAERYARWARHHPGIATLGAVLTAVLVLSTVVSLIVAGHMARLAEDRKNAANAERSARQDADRTAKAEIAARADADRARDAAKQARNAAAYQAAGLLLDRGIEDARGGEPARALHLFVQALRALPADDPRAAPLGRVIRANLTAWAETVPALEHIWPGGFWYTDIAFSPEADRIAMATAEDEVRCFRTDTGRPFGPPAKIPDGVGESIVFTPDSRSLWVASPHRRKTGAAKWAIHRLDPVSGRPVQPPIRTSGPVLDLSVSPEGRYLVGSVLGLRPDDPGPDPPENLLSNRLWRTASIMVWEIASGRVVRKVDVSAESYSSFMGLSPDGRSVTAWVPRESNAFEGITFTVDGDEPPIRLGLHPLAPSNPWALNFQNNRRTALVIKDDQIHRWSVINPGVVGPGLSTPFRMMYREPAPDGRSVIALEQGRVYDAGAWPPRPSGVRFAHPDWVNGVFNDFRFQDAESCEKYSSDERFIATWALMRSEVDRRLWRLPRPRGRSPMSPADFGPPSKQRNSYEFAQFDPHGETVVLYWHQEALETHDVLLADASTGAVRGTSVRHHALVRRVVFTRDARYFATASQDGTARVWDAATGRPAGPPLHHRNYVADVSFSPDGNTLAAGDYGPAGLIKLWDWRTGRELRPPLQHDDIVINIDFSPDGKYIAALKAPDWSKKPEMIIWEVGAGQTVFRAPHHYASHRFGQTRAAVGAFNLQFRPDGRAVVALAASGDLRLWEVPSGKLLGERRLDHAGVPRFSPDGRVVAAVANLGVRLLDADTLAPLPGGYLPHPDPIQDVAFSPDGAFLLTGHSTGSAQLWEVATRKPIGPPAVLIGSIRAVAFTPDGRTCVCVADDGTVRRWPVPDPFAEPDVARLADRVALLTGQRMDESQGLDFVQDDEWRSLRERLVGEGSTALVPPRPDAGWHDTVAADAQQDRDVFGAEWHLDRLAPLSPRDWTIPARRGRLLARAGRHEEAASSYAAARSLAPSPRDLADWLRAAAADDEATRRYDEGLWNLDRAVEITPDDWTLYATRAALADLAGHPDRATADLDEAIRRGAEASVIAMAADRAARASDWKRAAILLAAITRDPAASTGTRFRQIFASLKAGDNAGYRAACAGIAAQMPPVGPGLSPSQANNAAWAFALGPTATDDWTRPLGWMDHALARLAAAEKTNPAAKDQFQRTRHVFLNTRGAVLYRAGWFEEAARTLREGMEVAPQDVAFQDWLFLALAEHSLRHAHAAKEAAAKARAALREASAGSVWDRAEVDLLAAELDVALPLPGK
jgi:WD40 repeat protein/tetratricopeptide (TPR) repeat protein